MQYTLIRSQRRRTIGITIQHAQVRVSAPVDACTRTIERFLASKQHWINRHLQAQQAQLTQLQPRHWQHGEQLYWLGEPYQLDVRDGYRNTIEAIDKTLHIRLSRRVVQRQSRSKQLVTQWYQHQAMQWLDAQLPQQAERYGLHPKRWRVTNYRAKWGACNRQGELSFSWRLFAAPKTIVDYVLLHELCHLQHFDHSPQFWRLVETHMPDYQVAERWLKTHGHTLLNDDIFHYTVGSS